VGVDPRDLRLQHRLPRGEGRIRSAGEEPVVAGDPSPRLLPQTGQAPGPRQEAGRVEEQRPPVDPGSGVAGGAGQAEGDRVGQRPAHAPVQPEDLPVVRPHGHGRELDWQVDVHDRAVAGDAERRRAQQAPPVARARSRCTRPGSSPSSSPAGRPSAGGASRWRCGCPRRAPVRRTAGRRRLAGPAAQPAGGRFQVHQADRELTGGVQVPADAAARFSPDTGSPASRGRTPTSSRSAQSALTPRRWRTALLHRPDSDDAAGFAHPADSPGRAASDRTTSVT
jgi:hypothetical protein